MQIQLHTPGNLKLITNAGDMAPMCHSPPGGHALGFQHHRCTSEIWNVEKERETTFAEYVVQR